MATYEKRKLHYSYDGGGIELGYSAMSQAVHLTGESSSVIDEVWLYATNNGSTPATLTINIANTNSGPQFDLPAYSGLVLVVPGLPVTGTGSSGSYIEATDNDSTGSVYIFGYVNRITP